MLRHVPEHFRIILGRLVTRRYTKNPIDHYNIAGTDGKTAETCTNSNRDRLKGAVRQLMGIVKLEIIQVENNTNKLLQELICDEQTS